MKRIVLYDASAIERPTREDLHRLARLRLEARRGGCDLVLTGVGQRLRLLLAVTGLDELFTISADGMCGDGDGDSHAPEPDEQRTAESGGMCADSAAAEPGERGALEPGGTCGQAEAAEPDERGAAEPGG